MDCWWPMTDLDVLLVHITKYFQEEFTSFTAGGKTFFKGRFADIQMKRHFTRVSDDNDGIRCYLFLDD